MSEDNGTGKLSVYVPAVNAPSLDALGDAPARESLLYDESVDVFIEYEAESSEVLETLRHVLSVEVRASVSGSAPETNQAPGQAPRELSHLVFDKTVTAKKVDSSSSTKLVWHLEVPLRHPRMRLLRPRVVLTAVARKLGVKFAEGTASSRRPSSSQDADSDLEFGMFEPMTFGESWASSHRRERAGLRASPASNNNNGSPSSGGASASDHDQILVTAEREFPVFPAVNLRLKTSRTHAAPADEILVSVEIAASTNVKKSVSVQAVDLVVLSGTSRLLGTIELPCVLKAGEVAVATYQLAGSAAGKAPPGAHPRLRSVVITVESVVLFSDDSSTADAALKNPIITTKWDTGVDLDSIPTGGHHHHHHQHHQKSRATPNRSPVVVTSDAATLGTPFLGTGDAAQFKRPSSRALPASGMMAVPHSSGRSARGVLSGITATFSGPSAARAGDIVNWTVFVANKSHVQRSLSLVFLPEDNLAEAPPSRTSTMRSVIHVDPAPDTASAVSIAMSKHGPRADDPDRGLVSLVNDVKIGPLPPGACAQVELPVLALAPGVHSLDNVTLVDLVTSDGHDCKKLIKLVVEG